MKRAHVVLDTNVLISALLFGGHPRQILDTILAGTVDCSLSVPILDELTGVLQQPKFGFSSRQAMAVREELSTRCTIVHPSERIRAVDADPDDNRILECAVAARADIIISGDVHLLRLRVHRSIRILSPSEFLWTMGEGALPSKGKRRPKR
jgi:putative PIN family toxin of toxin-antitoxin system